MKIFHALLGYLAVTALPFLPLAYPLAAIDYDGFVTVNTTQKHDDSALIKSAPGDIIEARQISIPEMVVIFVFVASSVLTIAWISSDNPVRGDDVEFLVGHTLPETFSFYLKYRQQDLNEVCESELGYLPPPLFRRVRWC